MVHLSDQSIMVMALQIGAMTLKLVSYRGTGVFLQVAMKSCVSRYVSQSCDNHASELLSSL